MLEISKLAFFKCLELAMAAICFGFHYKSQTNDFDCDTVTIVACGGSIIIAAGSLMGYLMGSPINRKVDTFFSISLCALHLVVGVFNLMFFERYSKSEWKQFGFAKAILSIANTIIFLFNCVASWREAHSVGID